MDKKAAQQVKVEYENIEMAFIFVNMTPPNTNTVIVNKETGELFYRSEDDDLDEYPDDAGDGKYVEIPRASELRLGRTVALEYAAEHIPGDLDEVKGIFGQKGAYSRFKQLLNARGKLQEWLEFESERTKNALCAWCEHHGITVTP